jgi:hypothetical protein
VPTLEECKNITVHRDGRDALMSWANHRRKMRPDAIDMMNAAAAEDGVSPIERVWDGDMDTSMDEWTADQSPIVHLSSWWPLRHDPFALMVYCNDLKTDLRGEMERITAC